MSKINLFMIENFSKIGWALYKDNSLKIFKAYVLVKGDGAINPISALV